MVLEFLQKVYFFNDSRFPHFSPVEKQMDFMLLSCTLKMVKAIHCVFMYVLPQFLKSKWSHKIFRSFFLFLFFLTAGRKEWNTIE